MPLQLAFAKSANIVFQKIGGLRLDGAQMKASADQFGFNQAVPFDLPVEPSIALSSDGNEVDEANMAAGFTKTTTLSPLHGALIAGSVFAAGIMFEPYLVKEVRAEDRSIVYVANPEPWLTTMNDETAESLQKMMALTLKVGTAKGAYRNMSKSRALHGIDLGGKTGTLTGKDGCNRWFVGFGGNDDDAIALGVVLVYPGECSADKKVGGGKSVELSRKIFEYYFAQPLMTELSYDHRP